MKIVICFFVALLLIAVNSQNFKPCPSPRPAPSFNCPVNFQAACGYGPGIKKTFGTSCDACKKFWIFFTSEGACK